RSDELIALTFSEVAGMFRLSGNFINNIREPSGGFLSNLSIRKLRKICLSSSSPAARDCIREIDAIESLVSTGSENLLSFCETYLSVSENRKENIRIILKKLFDLSMYMRGWDGRNTEFPPIDTHLSQVEIDLNVTSAVNSFENSLETSGFNTLIKGLPIFKYTSGRFFVSNTPDEGVTLGERLNLMKRGD